MGMFDSVYMDCPNCGEVLEFQSKSDECFLAAYYVNKKDEIPKTIVADLEGQKEKCYTCKKWVKFPYRVAIL